MRKRFLEFTFARESRWMIVLYVLIPLVGILLAIVIPGLGDAGSCDTVAPSTARGA